MRADFGFMVILGLLALAGSIVNNGIVMIDKIEENRREGQTPYDAVINSAVSRFRPILLSVSTTMLGFLPLIINHDPLFYGMASHHVLRSGHRQHVYAELCAGALQHLFSGETAGRITYFACCMKMASYFMRFYKRCQRLENDQITNSKYQTNHNDRNSKSQTYLTEWN